MIRGYSNGDLAIARFIRRTWDVPMIIGLGLHGTPLAGTTLLHLSIDFDEREIFDWLLDNGADVNAAAAVDEEGFGGFGTPLYNALVSNTYLMPAADSTMPI